MNARKGLAALLFLVPACLASNAVGQISVQTTTQAAADWLGKLPLATPEGTVTLAALVPDDYTGSGFQVIPTQFDPGKTYLVQAAWLHGIGCPTNAKTAIPNATFTGIAGEGSFTDTACPVGDADPLDSRVEGLLLAKTGPTVTNFAAAAARIVGVKGQALNELGWDIRKQGVPPVPSASPLGSHCGAGAPRWNIETQDGRFFFLGCNSPVAPVQIASETGWIRMRWGGAFPLEAFEVPGFALVDITGMTIKSLSILFDEAQDEFGTPDKFGAAVLDNIAINGVMTGKGSTNAR